MRRFDRSLFPINLKYGISTKKLVEVFSVNHTNTIFKIASLLLMGKSTLLYDTSLILVSSVIRDICNMMIIYYVRLFGNAVVGFII